MPWNIENRNGYCVATMRSNSVNMMNAEFFSDVHSFLDTMERESRSTSIVLASGTPKAFSAGLDFRYAFPIFASGDRERIRTFVREYCEVYYRLFLLPNPVIAAIEGPAIAGGLILLCCSDYRIASRRRSRFALNEVRIGIPMPAAYSELIRHAVGSRVAEELILRGGEFDAEEGHRLGVVHEVVEDGAVLDRAAECARAVDADSMVAYGVSKVGIRGPVVSRCRILNRHYDDSQLIDGLMAVGSVRKRERTRRLLTERRAG